MGNRMVFRLVHVVVVASLIVVAFTSNPQAGEPALKAIVKDSKGISYNVSGLYAKYTAGGTWLGSRPERTRSSLFISLSMTKNRVTTEEKIELPFSKVRRIIYKDFEVPKDMQSSLGGAGSVHLQIEMRDGKMMYFGKNLIIESATDGKQKEAAYTSLSFKNGESQGQSITLDGFGGRSKSETGTEGDFWIPTGETASIQFE